MSPAFSIIIPVYNVAPYLRECLDSVLAQTFTDWECICIDDGSTDGSGAILDEYAAKDSRFRVFHQQNAGVSAARNKGLDEAQGEWVCFVDGDDAIAPNWLDFARNLIRQNIDLDVVRLSCESCKIGDGMLNAKIAFCKGEPRRCHDSDIVEWGMKSILASSLVVLNFYRRGVFEKVRFPVGIRFREDDIQQFDALLYVMRGVEADFPGYFYRKIRPGAASRKVGLDDSISFLRGFLSVAEKWEQLKPECFSAEFFRENTTKIIMKDFWFAFWGDVQSGRFSKFRFLEYRNMLFAAMRKGLFQYRHLDIGQRFRVWTMFSLKWVWVYLLPRKIKRIVDKPF